MPTKEEVAKIHGALDAATDALTDLLDARVARNEAGIEDACRRLSSELGRCKEALRVVRSPT